MENEGTEIFHQWWHQVIAKWPQKTLELILVSQMDGRGPSMSAIICHFPQYISMELEQKWSR